MLCETGEGRSCGPQRLGGVRGPDEDPFWTQTQFCLLHACCVTLGTGLLSGPKPAYLQDGRSLAHFSPQPATSGGSCHRAATFWAEYSLEGGHQEEGGPLPGVPTQLSISRGRGPPSCLGGARHPEVPRGAEGTDCLLGQRRGQGARRKRSRLGGNLSPESGGSFWRAGR